LRQAEVEISLERAKLARERAELEDKLRAWETERSTWQAAAGEATSDKTKKPAGRKWLARLGLGDSEPHEK
jgi:hypothetical protein